MGKDKKIPDESPFLRGIKVRLKTASPENRVHLIREAAGTPSFQSLLWELLEDPHEKVRDYAVKELSGFDSVDVSLLNKKLRHPNWFVRCAALKLLGKRNDLFSPESTEPLLHDSNAEVRKTAAWTLGEIGGKESVKKLVKLTHDKNRFVRAEAEKALDKASRLKFT
jgi:HEAT repeat protein